MRGTSKTRILSILICVFVVLFLLMPTGALATAKSDQGNHGQRGEHPQQKEHPHSKGHPQKNQPKAVEQNQHPNKEAKSDSNAVVNHPPGSQDLNPAKAKSAVADPGVPSAQKKRATANKASNQASDVQTKGGKSVDSSSLSITSENSSISSAGAVKSVAKSGGQIRITGTAQNNAAAQLTKETKIQIAGSGLPKSHGKAAAHKIGKVTQTESIDQDHASSENGDDLQTSSGPGEAPDSDPLVVDLIIAPSAMAEPTTGGSPDDRDGSPPVSGSADPEEMIIVAEMDISVTLVNVMASIEIRAGPDGAQDLTIDNDNPRDLGTLIPGTYYLYWSVHKDQSIAKKNHVEEFRVMLTYESDAGSKSYVSDWSTVDLQGSTSIKQNDLRWLETGSNLEGSNLVVVSKYQQMSQNILHSLIVQGFYDGAVLRLEDVRVYYYDTKDDPGSVAGGVVPPDYDGEWAHKLYFAVADFPPTMTSGDHWIVEYHFSVIGNSVLTVIPYIQTKESANANWKLDAGYAEIQIIEGHRDLWVEKDGPSTAEPGETYSYTISFGNRATATAHAEGVIIVDTLPAHGVPSNFGEGVYDEIARTITWYIGKLCIGESKSITFDLTIPDVMPCGWTDLVNSVTIFSKSLDEPCELQSTKDDNQDSVTTTVEAHRDLWIEKDGPSTAEPGETYSYTISFGNRATATAHAEGVVIVDTLPAHGVPSNFGQGVYDEIQRTITWHISQLGVGESKSISFDCTIPSVMPCGWTGLLDKVTIFSETQDEDCELQATKGDNQDSVTTMVEALLDLWIDKEGPAIAEPRDTYMYTISYGNSGNADATNVQIVDMLPPHLTVLDADGGVIVGDTITWSIGTLHAGDSYTGEHAIHLKVQVDLEMPFGITILTNAVKISSDEPPEFDKDLANNQDQVDTIVNVIEFIPFGEPEVVPPPAPAVVEAAQVTAEPAPTAEKEEALPFTGSGLDLNALLAALLVACGIMLWRHGSKASID